MSNETITFKGKLRWASVPPNPPRKPYEIDPANPEDCSYSIEVECSEEKFKELKKKGIPKLTELREGENGETYIRLRASKIKGKYTFPDVPVVDSNGNGISAKIGNGSEGMVRAELADIKGRSGKALRLKAVMVTNLIEFSQDDVAELLKEAGSSGLPEAYAEEASSSEENW